MKETKPSSLRDVLARLFWMLLGPGLLVLCGFWIIQTGNGWLTAADVAFIGVLIAMMMARWLEFEGGNPQTAEGKPATPGSLRRYAIGVVAVGGGVWITANVFANHLLN